MPILDSVKNMQCLRLASLAFDGRCTLLAGQPGNMTVAVYVDDMDAPFGLMKMCHMVADSLDELHDMAEQIGMARRWFQSRQSFPHYDVSQPRKQRALELGARPIKRRELPLLVARIEVSGGFGEFGDLEHGREKLDFYTRRALRQQTTERKITDPGR